MKVSSLGGTFFNIFGKFSKSFQDKTERSRPDLIR